ncbi:hypothetical protein [Pengzhenrongella sicca]|uniref:Uncharacterized protein n=1 Tax=Pengzhenrongella sicca TaxID=2819238 RepID=A0A8A4ZC24_9MICO|nr:hypothetical protein [Pengzhenrongella sicca]QTE28559.1 hypothetical protein J4E96_14465 [Pengzhenrongella sicca]
MDDRLSVHVVAGGDSSTADLVRGLTSLSVDRKSRLELQVATKRSPALALLAQPCDVFVLSGHGYSDNNEEPAQWLLGGQTPASAVFTRADVPATFAASFVIFDTCGAHTLLPGLRIGLDPLVTLAYGSTNEDDFSSVASAQHTRVLRFIEAALDGAAMPGGGYDEPDFTKTALRRTWDWVTTHTLTSPRNPRYLLIPPVPVG